MSGTARPEGAVRALPRCGARQRASSRLAVANRSAHHVDRRVDPRPDAEGGCALAHERLAAVDDLTARGAGRGDERGLLRTVGEVDDDLPGLRLYELLVADGSGVHDQVAPRR